MRPSTTFAVACTCLAVAACDDSDERLVATQAFHVRIENVAPWTVLESAAQLVQTDGTRAPAGPGGVFAFRFTAGKGHAVSFAAMLGESNDWFFAPDGLGIPLYDAAGNPMSGDVTTFVRLWNAGTEIDEEPGVGAATGPNQPSPGFGVRDPDGRVRLVPSIIQLSDGSSFAVPAVASMIRATLVPSTGNAFVLQIENVSTPATLVTSHGAMAIHISPLAWAVHQQPDPFFVAGTPERRKGLERLAEDGVPDALAATLAADTGFATPLSPGVATDRGRLYDFGADDFGQGLEALAEDGDPRPLHLARPDTIVFDTPIGATSPRPAAPGEAFELEITGPRLKLATMFGMSNDWIFTTPPDGILLVDGDLSDQLLLVDLGTEADELAIGPDTAPQQPAPNTGPPDPIPFARPAAYDRRVVDHVRLTASSLR